MFIFAQHALLPNGWATNVTIEIDNGWIVDVSTTSPASGWEYVVDTALPGIANLHSHTFQRSFAGSVERRSSGTNNFWSWREVMYRAALAVDPDSLYRSAFSVYREMLLAGYSAVAEFHYIHRDPDGRWYDDKSVMAQALVQAALDAGIFICLLPALYECGGAGGKPLEEMQRRFESSPDDILEIAADIRRRYQGNASVVVGVCAHSLRAVTLSHLNELLEGAPQTVPVHLHLAEQDAEVAEIQSQYRARPAELLLRDFRVDARWTLVHATQSESNEVSAIAASGAVVGLCPTTEANLGDGIFPFESYVLSGGTFGIGSDSNVTISPVEELRLLEYGQRLIHRRRPIASRGDLSCGETLYIDAASGGAQACASRGGSIAAGKRADLVVLGPRNDGVADAKRLDRYIFSDRCPVPQHVMTTGRWRVFHGELQT